MGHTEELLEKQKELAGARRDIDELEFRMKEMVAEFDHRGLQALAMYNEQTELAKKEYEDQIRKLRIQSQGELADTIQSIEAKYEAERAELVSGHKKQVDDLRSFFSVSAINLKKEAEATRQHDLKQLKAQHDSEMFLHTKQYKEELEKRLEELAQTKDQAMNDLTEDYENRVTNLKMDLEESKGLLAELRVCDD